MFGGLPYIIHSCPGGFPILYRCPVSVWEPAGKAGRLQVVLPDRGTDSDSGLGHKPASVPLSLQCCFLAC